MLHITVLTKRSVFFVFLVTNTITPLLATSTQNVAMVQQNHKQSTIHQNITNILIQKGLDEKVAIDRVTKLFKEYTASSSAIANLYKYPELFGSKEKVNNTLANYALHEKSIRLNSYASLIALAQRNSLKPLSKKQLDTVSSIASINLRTNREC